MEKKHFMIKFLPRRHDFAKTMTDEEKAIVVQHHGYWKGHMSHGTMLLFGPVYDPKGTFGIGIIAAESDEEVKKLLENDPASKIHTYEYYPMNTITPEK